MIMISECPEVFSRLPQLLQRIGVFFLAFDQIQRRFGNLLPGSGSQICSYRNNAASAGIGEETGFISIIHPEISPMSDGVLVVLSPFQWSQKDESLNAFDFHKIFEDAGTQVVPLERPGDFLDEIRIIVKDEREPGEAGQFAVMREKPPIAVIEEWGVHPENGPGIMPGGQTLFQELEHFFRLFSRFSADPDPQRNTASDNGKRFVEEFFPSLNV